jgi:hypothetical protein
VSKTRDCLAIRRQPGPLPDDYLRPESAKH